MKLLFRGCWLVAWVAQELPTGVSFTLVET